MNQIMGKKLNSFLLLVMIFISSMTEVNAQWTQCTGLGNFSISSFASIGSYLFAGTLEGGFIYLSKDSGATWTQLVSIAQPYHVPRTQLIEDPIIVLFADSTRLIAGVGGLSNNIVKISTSTDNGLTWTKKDSSFIYNVNCFTSNNGTIFAGTDNGVFLSTDYGTSWSASNSGLNNAYYDSIYHHSPSVLSIIAKGTDIFAWTNTNELFHSTDSGKNWNAIKNELLQNIYGLAVIGNDLFIGSFNGVILSSDNGNNFQAVDTSIINYPIITLITNGTNLFAENNEGIFLSTNKGGNWTNISPQSQVGPHGDAIILGVYDSYLFADSYSFWRRPLSDIITGVNQKNKLPTSFSLQQNFPNPFNPTTTIIYSIPKSCFVSIKVYDILGREVTTIVNENKLAGNYTVQFNAVKLTSGIYFYRMQAGDFVQTKKLILIK